jgi:hypothetical protein
MESASPIDSGKRKRRSSDAYVPPHFEIFPHYMSHPIQKMKMHTSRFMDEVIFWMRQVEVGHSVLLQPGDLHHHLLLCGLNPTHCRRQMRV